MDFDLLILYLLVIGLVITSIYTPQWPYIEDPQHINLTKTSYFHKRCSIGINFPCITPAIKLSEFTCIIFLCACPPACCDKGLSFQKSLFLCNLCRQKQCSQLQCFQIWIVYFCILVEDFECQVVFWYCYCKLK